MELLIQLLGSHDADAVDGTIIASDQHDVLGPQDFAGFKTIVSEEILLVQVGQLSDAVFWCAFEQDELVPRLSNYEIAARRAFHGPD